MSMIEKRAYVLENDVAKQNNSLKPVDAPVYGYWAALCMSFYSSRLYVDVGKRWRGIGILYLLLVVAIGSIPYSVRMIVEFNNDFKQRIIQPIAVLPTIMIQNGSIVFDKPMPYFLKNNQGQVVSIIDTTGTITKFDDTYPDLAILINKDVIYYKLPTPHIVGAVTPETEKGVVLAQPFDKSVNMIFDGKKIIQENSIAGLKYAGELMIYPFIVSVFYSIFLVIFLTFAFLGQLFAKIFFSFHISFKQSCRLYMVSVTPMCFIFMALLSLNWIFPGLGFVLLVLMFGYFSFAIKSLRVESREVVRS